MEHKNTPRLYIDGPLGQDTDAELTPDQVHYIKNVLRKKQSDNVRLFNGRDGEWLYQLDEVKKKSIIAKADTNIRPQAKKRAPLMLFFAPLKKSQTDMVIQKATELGVDEICPITTEYSNTNKIRIDRWRATAIEAAEQSERLTIPGISELTNLKTAVRNFPSSGQLNVALERIKGSIQPCKMDAEHPCGLIIGPEGGFSDEEKEYFVQNPRFNVFSMGTQILRAETAAIVGLGLLQYT